MKYAISGVSIVISMFFAWRSFYGMRISGAQAAKAAAHPPEKAKPAEEPAA